jgi:endonuclease YncB( thermonuclease family)
MNGLLELHGTLDLAQLWPEGHGDADTFQIAPAPLAFRWRPHPTVRVVVLRTLEHAVVEGRFARPVVDRGHVTVRLQGVDAPELHELRAWLFRGAKKSVLPVLVRRAVAVPTQAFDMYGRLVGELLVPGPRGERSVNAWLAEHGWALPTLYASMTSAARAQITDLARAASRARRGAWAHHTPNLAAFDPDLVFRPAPASAHDRGRVILPTLFRRLSMHASLADTPDRAWLASELTAEGERARLYGWHELVSASGRFRVAPEDIVLRDRPAALRMATAA